MKMLPLCWLALLLLAAGCRSHYELTLNNATKVDAWSKPKLTGGFYHFKDAAGQPASIPAGRVREINRK
jgi:hypothetical protein